MSVQRRVNWISQQRVGVPDMRSVESAASNDFDQLIQGFVTDTSQGYVLRGFEIIMTGAIGGAASGLQMLVDPGALFHIKASQSGAVLMVPAGTPLQQLNSATNTQVDGAFTPNAINYVGVDYERFLDDTTSAQVYIWDPTTNSETTKIAPRASILRFRLKVSTTVWPSNILPIAVVTTDAGNNVLSITDARWGLFRLGTGGASPNPFYVYPWTAQTEGREENPSTSSDDSVSPFHGGDKMLASLKEWMNAVMSAILEIRGTTYWYELGTAGSLASLREDALNTVFTGNSTISHGILPNTTPVLTTTGDISTGSNQILNLASTTGLANNQIIMGTGIPTNTTIINITGSTVTMSNNAVATIVADALSFYAPSTVTAPGQMNWASDPPGGGQLYFKIIGSRLSYQIEENPTGASVVLADNQVAYITLTRGILIAPNLIFTNGSAVVSSVGAVPWTANLQAGDWIKKAADTDAGYYKILTVNSVSSVTLTENYGGTSTSVSGAKVTYAFGVYRLPGATGTARDIVIADREDVPTSANVVWLFLRSDDGGSVPRVYVKFLGAELRQGTAIEISGPTLNNVLQYIGSPVESAIGPLYVSALNSGSIPEIVSITTGTAASVASNQYFYINSSGNSRRYYVWINKNGTGVDPMPLFVGTGVEWVVSTGQTANQLATNLAIALNSTFFNDFTAVSSTNTITVTNNSAGATNAPSNFNVGAPFSISVSQAGTGIGNYAINDGDNLTLAIKELDEVLASFASSFQRNGYDEVVEVVASGATPPTSINSPIVPGTNIQLPNDSRNGNIPMYYGVGSGKLQVFLNGQKLIVGADYTEFGTTGASSQNITTLRTLITGDEIEFNFTGGGGGSGGGSGSPGPAGPAGPPGADAAGGPISISTKVANYTVLLTDCFLRADCTATSVTFTLPPAATASGRIFYFKKVDATANAMILQAFGAELIDGFNTKSSTLQYWEFAIISNGVSWDIF